MSHTFSVAIIEADNALVGFSPPTNDDIEKHPPETPAQWIGELLYSQNLISSRPRNASNIPMLGPLYAASLLKARYPADMQVKIYVPWISEQATTHSGIQNIIEKADVVVVSAVTFFSWAQKEIIRLAKQAGKKVIATGAHARMYEGARGLLVEAGDDPAAKKIPRSRHDGCNDELVDFPGADYVLQHDHYNAFLKLIDLIKRSVDAPAAVGAITGIGYIDAAGHRAGLTVNPRDMIIPDIPDLLLDFTLIDGYGHGISIVPLPGSAQGCINSCEFCQIKQFMGNRFLYTSPGRVYENLQNLLRIGFLKKARTRLGAWLSNNVFITDDSPVLGGELERELPFDYIEFMKVADYLWELRSRGQTPAAKTVVRIPEASCGYIKKRDPYMLKRLKRYGLAVHVEGNLVEGKPRCPISLSGLTLSEAAKALETIASTRADNPEARPFFSHPAHDAGRSDTLGRQLRRNFIEFSKMLNEIEEFQADHACRLSLSIEISVRAVRLLGACTPCTLRRMRSLGFDMLQIGLEDILSDDTRGVTGIVKATYQENCQALQTCNEAGIGAMALLICPTQNYELGDALKMTRKLMELGADFYEVFSEKAWEGTPLTRKHRQQGRCLYQLTQSMFSGPWRELANALEGGEVVTTRPDKASMLGLQLDIIDSYFYFNRLSNRWAYFKRQVRNRAIGNAVYFLTVCMLNQSIVHDLFRWLCRVPVRSGKSYVQILAGIDDRWKSEPYTLQLVDKLKIRSIIDG